jgi:hypothetical protein
LNEELRFHVEMRAADLEREGLSAADAHRQAGRLLGNAASLRDRTRESDVWVSLETAVQDVRYALRLLRRTPMFTLAAGLTLALGIGVNTAMFGVLYGVLIRPLSYPDADRLRVESRSTSSCPRRASRTPSPCARSAAGCTTRWPPSPFS